MNRRHLHTVLFAGLLAVAQPPAVSAHDAAEGLTAALQACAAESDAAGRLACFDREVALLPKPAPVEQPEPAAAATSPVLSAEERFGLTESAARRKEKFEKAPQLESLEALVTKISRRPRGELVMTLDNGQIWVQRQAATFDVRVGDAVTIKAGVLGSFTMSTASGRFTRVARMP